MDLTFNKVAGAVLATGLALVGLRELANGVAVMAESRTIASRYVSDGIHGELIPRLDPALMAAEKGVSTSAKSTPWTSLAAGCWVPRAMLPTRSTTGTIAAALTPANRRATP